jgi:hypothetical protein|tara:strand:+ start:82 stop:240 length:159 start_codon:yes stop_codon:yes gene_type:complete
MKDMQNNVSAFYNDELEELKLQSEDESLRLPNHSSGSKFSRGNEIEMQQPIM